MHFLTLILCLFFVRTAHSEMVTIAGTGTGGFSGDGGPAAQAQLNRPTAVFADTLNNIYIADGNNACIRKIDPSGIITTIAGTGTEGFAGDNGPATQAQFNRPHGVTLDSQSNIYISDTRNNRIRKIDPSGIVTTIAGTGIAGAGGDGGLATQAQINRPHGVAIDTHHNIYIADTNNNCIRKIDTAGIITTLISNINGPTSVAIDASNNLYIAERSGNRILKADSTSATTILAGNGQTGFSEDGTEATEANLGSPRGIAVTAQGTVYFSERENQRIRSIADNNTLITVAGNGIRGDERDNGSALEASLNFPWGVFVVQNYLYIADRENHRLRRVTQNQTQNNPSDFNLDQKVDFQDFILFASHFGSSQNQDQYNAQFDLDNNGNIGFSDFLIFVQAFGK